MVLTEDQEKDIKIILVGYYCSNCDSTYDLDVVDRYCICGVEPDFHVDSEGNLIEIPCLFETCGKWKSDLDQSVIYAKN